MEEEKGAELSAASLHFVCVYLYVVFVIPICLCIFIKACLCTTPFCNEGSNDPLIQQAAAQEAAKKKDSPPKASSSSSRTTSPPRRSQTTRRPSRTTTRRSQNRNDFRSKPAKSEKRKPVRLQSSSQRLSSSKYLINCFHI